jgi:hypothetical protein
MENNIMAENNLQKKEEDNHQLDLFKNKIQWQQ